MKFQDFISDIVDSLSDYGFIVYYNTTYVKMHHNQNNIPLLAQSLQELYNSSHDCWVTIQESVSLAKSLIKWYNL